MRSSWASQYESLISMIFHFLQFVWFATVFLRTLSTQYLFFSVEKMSATFKTFAARLNHRASNRIMSRLHLHRYKFMIHKNMHIKSNGKITQKFILMVVFHTHSAQQTQMKKIYSVAYDEKGTICLKRPNFCYLWHIKHRSSSSGGSIFVSTTNDLVMCNNYLEDQRQRETRKKSVYTILWPKCKFSFARLLS